MVDFPGEYSWSSFQPKVTGEGWDILDKDFFYSDIGRTDKERQDNYCQWVLQGVPTEELSFIRRAVQKGGIIGSDLFHGKIEKISGKPVYLKKRGRPRK
jgi:hypothetical protein